MSYIRQKIYFAVLNPARRVAVITLLQQNTMVTARASENTNTREACQVR